MTSWDSDEIVLWIILLTFLGTNILHFHFFKMT